MWNDNVSWKASLSLELWCDIKFPFCLLLRSISLSLPHSTQFSLSAVFWLNHSRRLDSISKIEIWIFYFEIMWKATRVNHSRQLIWIGVVRRFSIFLTLQLYSRSTVVIKFSNQFPRAQKRCDGWHENRSLIHIKKVNNWKKEQMNVGTGNSFAETSRKIFISFSPFDEFPLRRKPTIEILKYANIGPKMTIKSDLSIGQVDGFRFLDCGKN